MLWWHLAKFATITVTCARLLSSKNAFEFIQWLMGDPFILYDSSQCCGDLSVYCAHAYLGHSEQKLRHRSRVRSQWNRRSSWTPRECFVCIQSNFHLYWPRSRCSVCILLICMGKADIKSPSPIPELGMCTVSRTKNYWEETLWWNVVYTIPTYHFHVFDHHSTKGSATSSSELVYRCKHTVLYLRPLHGADRYKEPLSDVPELGMCTVLGTKH